MDEFSSLRSLSSAFNQAIGRLITFFLLEVVFFYSVELDELFGGMSWSEIVNFVVWGVNACAILYFCAESSHLMQTLLDWLRNSENTKDIRDITNVVECHLVIHELSTNKVSIKGSNVYPVTYNLVASVRLTFTCKFNA